MDDDWQASTNHMLDLSDPLPHSAPHSRHVLRVEVDYSADEVLLHDDAPHRLPLDVLLAQQGAHALEGELHDGRGVGKRADLY